MKLSYFTIADMVSGPPGAVAHIEGIVNGLHSQGWQITLLSSCDGSGAAQPKYPFKHVLTKRRTPSLFNQFLEQFRLVCKLFFGRNPKPDVIYIRAYYTLIAPVIYACCWRIPFFVEINALAEIEGTHTRLVPLAVRANGCDTSLCEETKNLKEAVDGSPTVGFLGNFQVRQGVEALLRAVPSIKKEISDVRFIIAGSGKLVGKYKAIVKELKIEDCVIFSGRIPREEVGAVLRQFDVAVAPYIGELRKIPMGSPLKIFTYLGAGKVVVTSELPALALFKDCPAVRFARSDDPESFAKVIVEVLRMSPDERAGLGREGQQFVMKDYTWDQLARKTSDLILQWIKHPYYKKA